jgi:hypothetical protein
MGTIEARHAVWFACADPAFCNVCMGSSTLVTADIRDILVGATVHPFDRDSRLNFTHRTLQYFHIPEIHGLHERTLLPLSLTLLVAEKPLQQAPTKPQILRVSRLALMMECGRHKMDNHNRCHLLHSLVDRAHHGASPFILKNCKYFDAIIQHVYSTLCRRWLLLNMTSNSTCWLY